MLTTPIGVFTLVKAAVIVPTKITKVMASLDGSVTIFAYGRSAAPKLLPFTCRFEPTMDDKQKALMTSLSPALAACLPAEPEMDDTTGAINIDPVAIGLPPPMIEALNAVPCHQNNYSGDIRDALLRVRRAMQDTGYHVPPLNEVMLHQLTLEQWMQTHAGVTDRLADVERQLMGMVKRIQELMNELRVALLDATVAPLH